MDHFDFPPRDKGKQLIDSQIELLRQKFKDSIRQTVQDDPRLSGCFVYGSAASLFSRNVRMTRGSDIDVIPITKKSYTSAERRDIASEFSNRLKEILALNGISISVDFSSPEIKGTELAEIMIDVEYELTYGYTTDFALILLPEISEEVITAI